jgi:DNA replication protein DnaC
MVGAIETLLEQLQLPHMATVLSDHLERAAHEELSYGEFLRGLLEGEVANRMDADTHRRLLQAGFPFFQPGTRASGWPV